MSRKPDTVEDLKSLTSLRFIAAMMILLVHSLLFFKWEWLRIVSPNFIQGVSFFFVLSGFILTHVYSQRHASFLQFMRARLARIFPVHLATLALVPLLVRADSISFDGPGLQSKWLILAANITLLQSLVPLFAYNFSWNGVAWSISTELFFYLAFPILLANLKRTWAVKLLICAILLATAEACVWLFAIPAKGNVYEFSAASLVYVSPPMRIFEFCLGMASYIAWQHVRRWGGTIILWSLLEVGTLVLAYLAVVHGYAMLHPFTASLPIADKWAECCSSSPAFALAIIVFASARGLVGRMLTTAPCVWLGHISFSLYMVHLIVMKVMFLNIPSYCNELTVYGFCLLAGAALYHGIETPARLALTRGMTRNLSTAEPGRA